MNALTLHHMFFDSRRSTNERDQFCDMVHTTNQQCTVMLAQLSSLIN